MTLEKIIRDANINQRGNIFYKSVHILAYADDIDIIDIGNLLASSQYNLYDVYLLPCIQF